MKMWIKVAVLSGVNLEFPRIEITVVRWEREFLYLFVFSGFLLFLKTVGT